MIPINDVPALQQDKFKVIAGVNFFASMRLNLGSVAVLNQIFGTETVSACSPRSALTKAPC